MALHRLSTAIQPTAVMARLRQGMETQSIVAMALHRLSTAIQPTAVMARPRRDMETQSIAAMALHLRAMEIPCTTTDELLSPNGAVYYGTTTYLGLATPLNTVEGSRPKRR